MTRIKGPPFTSPVWPESSRRFRLQDFHDIRRMKVVRYSVSHTSRLYPTNIPGTHYHQGVSRSQRLGAAGKQYVKEKSSVTTGNRLRLVTQHLNHHATPGTNWKWKGFRKTSSFVTGFIDKKMFYRINEKKKRDSKRLWPLQGTWTGMIQ
jgi:hypothetical protein